MILPGFPMPMIGRFVGLEFTVGTVDVTVDYLGASRFGYDIDDSGSLSNNTLFMVNGIASPIYTMYSNNAFDSYQNRFRIGCDTESIRDAAIVFLVSNYSELSGTSYFYDISLRSLFGQNLGGWFITTASYSDTSEDHWDSDSISNTYTVQWVA